MHSLQRGTRATRRQAYDDLHDRRGSSRTYPSQPRRDPAHLYIQKRVNSAIMGPAFHFRLPELGSHISFASRDQRSEIFETIGDGLLHSVVALEMYKHYPEATPHYITIARAVINSNCTFAHFMVKSGAFVNEPDLLSGKTSKAAADAFETLVAAFYFERGFDALREWAGDVLGPLFDVTQQAYNDRCKKRSRPEQDHQEGPSQKRRKSDDASIFTSTTAPYRRARSLSAGHDDVQMLQVPRKLKRTVATPEHYNLSNQAASSSSKLHAPRAEVIDLTNARGTGTIESTKSGGAEVIDLTDDRGDEEWIDCDAEDPFVFGMSSHTTAAIQDDLPTLSPGVASGLITTTQVLNTSLPEDTLPRLMHFKKPMGSVSSNTLANRTVAELELSGLLLLPNPSSSRTSHTTISTLSKRRLWLNKKKKDAKKRKLVHESAVMRGVELIEVFD